MSIRSASCVEPGIHELLHPSSFPTGAPFNRAPFEFRHRLTSSDVFSFGSIRDVIRQNAALAATAYWSNGIVHPDDPWRKGMCTGTPLLETFDHIAENDSLIMLRPLETEPHFAPIVRALMRGLIGLNGACLRDDMIRGRATLLIASPKRITSYHIDADTNFLFQIHGRKAFHVFPPGDPRLISAPEIERYFMGDPNGARYSAERQADAVSYDLGPGRVVHVPPIAPHWAQNGDTVSVALSVNFDLRSVARRAHVHRMNHYLRRVGVTPIEAGRSAWRDGAKMLGGMAIQALRPAGSRFKKALSAPAATSGPSRVRAH